MRWGFETSGWPRHDVALYGLTVPALEGLVNEMAKTMEQGREQRKIEHVSAVRTLGDNQASSTWFEDVTLLPNCAPELAWDEISLQTELCGFSLPSPVIINAMTGGADEVYEINRRLAAIARRFGLAMAVGSETAALKNPDVAYTYSVVREQHPNGVLLANVGMGTASDVAQAAVDLIGAQLLQVHFNVAQELFMAEGDRDFRGALSRLAEVVEAVDVPVIAKEVGQGIAAQEARQFVDVGVRAIDVGGRGGTNFIAVEAWRRNMQLTQQWMNWGISTAATLSEVVHVVPSDTHVIASGGIRAADEIVKAMALGAKAVGIAGPLVRLLGEPDGDEAVIRYLEELHWGMRTLLALTGSRTWGDLRTRPVVVGGRLKLWLESRGHEAFVQTLHGRGRQF